MNDQFFIKKALGEAQKAVIEGEIPIGAVLVEKETVIAEAHNTREESKNPLHHAEMIVLEQAGEGVKDWRLNQMTLYVTVEPCLMCLGALLQARVGRLVFGCPDDKRNPVHLLEEQGKDYSFPSLSKTSTISGNNHTLQITGGVLEEECRRILQSFFETHRKK